MSYVIHGRCRSGRRWFWIAAEVRYREEDGGHRCDDPVCVYGGPHECGWADTEDVALKAMGNAVARLGGEVHPGCHRGNAPGRARDAASALKRINAAKRAARPPSGETGTAPVEYLYEPWSWYDDSSETHKGVSEIPIVKKRRRSGSTTTTATAGTAPRASSRSGSSTGKSSSPTPGAGTTARETFRQGWCAHRTPAILSIAPIGATAGATRDRSA